MKKAALPVHLKVLFDQDGNPRADLTPEERALAASYLPVPFTADEIAEREADAQAQAEQDLKSSKVAALLECRSTAAEQYPYKGIIIRLTDGVRADLSAYYFSLLAGELPSGFVLPWSERGYEGSENETILIPLADLGAFCLGARFQRERAFQAYSIIAAQMAEFETPEAVQDAYAAALAGLVNPE